MENKINIAELLKDCPKGMELDCTICNNVVTLEGVDTAHSYPIEVVSKSGFHHILTCEGYVYAEEDAKCVIFPKGETTWEGFVPPHKYKNGDVVITALGSTAIIGGPAGNTGYYAHCVWVCGKLITDDIIDVICFATESEKAELFKAIKENGYKWNAENKTLEKLIEPKFKVGDKIKLKENRNYIYTITGIREKENKYECGVTFVLRFSEQDNWELVPNKFDISTLKPFDRVLARDYDNTWATGFYSHFETTELISYYVVNGTGVDQCIPYEGNEHLLGTKNDCDEYYKTWEEEA